MQERLDVTAYFRRREQQYLLRQRQGYKPDAVKRVDPNKIIGTYRYYCSNCGNNILFGERLEDRKILCTQCNNGFFE